MLSDKYQEPLPHLDQVVLPAHHMVPIRLRLLQQISLLVQDEWGRQTPPWDSRIFRNLGAGGWAGGPDGGCCSGEPGGRGDGHAVAVHDPGVDGKVNSNLFKGKLPFQCDICAKTFFRKG